MDQQPNGAPKSAATGENGSGEPKLTQLDATLEHLGRLCLRLEQAEQRFKQMTDECSNVLDGLVSVDRRHASTLATLNDRLGDWCSIERKLLEESAQRIERFERGVEHEWTALRRLHEEPIDELRIQADKLRIACLDAASLARQRLDAAEQGYALQAADLERRLAEWSRRVLEGTSRAITDGSDGNGQPPGDIEATAGPPVEPWPLDGVAQLHQELRTGSASSPRVQAGQPEHNGNNGTGTAPSDRATASDTEDAAIVHVTATAPAANRPYARWRVPAIVTVVLGFVTIAVMLYIGQMQRRLAALETKTREAAQQSDKPAPAQAAPAREPEVQQAANRAGMMVSILAAPDLRRYDLAGLGPGQGAYGQVLWSRTTGMAVTAMRLRAAPGKFYRVWVIGDGRTVTAGVLEFEGAATARLIVAGPLTLPRPIAFTVTLEDTTATDRPTGPVYLGRVPTS